MVFWVVFKLEISYTIEGFWFCLEDFYFFKIIFLPW
jgi:hypothetical protein